VTSLNFMFSSDHGPSGGADSQEQGTELLFLVLCSLFQQVNRSNISNFRKMQYNDAYSNTWWIFPADENKRSDENRSTCWNPYRYDEFFSRQYWCRALELHPVTTNEEENFEKFISFSA